MFISVGLCTYIHFNVGVYYLRREAPLRSGPKVSILNRMEACSSFMCPELAS